MLPSKLAKTLFYFSFGFIVVLLGSVFFILLTPLYLYRWIITGFLAPVFFRNQLVNVIDHQGTHFSADFLHTQNPPRCTAISNFVFDNVISYHELFQAINEKWIGAKDSNGKLKYPEFQQYLESWMGFMFWKPESNFCLAEHIKSHTIEKSGNGQDSEDFRARLNEQLLNAPYLEKFSPWELHLVENYKHGSENTSLIIFRIHHAMGDSFAMLHLLIEQLCDSSFESACVTQPSKTTTKVKFTNILVSAVYLPFKVFHVAGRAIFFVISQPRTAFHVLDENKKWRQICQRSEPIPVPKIKHIKNKLGVSFAAVLYSAFGAAIGKTMAKLTDGDIPVPNYLAIGTAVPAKYHAKKLTNHVLGVAYDIPINPELAPFVRLKLCEKKIRQEKNSVILTATDFVSKCIFLLPVHFVKILLKNNYLATIGSTVAGPQTKISFNDASLVALEGCVGGQIGNAGFLFFAVSYRDQLRLMATAEAAVISEKELEELLKLVQEEIKTLYELTKNTVPGIETNERLVGNNVLFGVDTV